MANLLKKIADFVGEEDKKANPANANTPEENKFIVEIQKNQDTAEALRGNKAITVGNKSSVNYGIEEVWKDEYKIYVGDQWDTSFAKRTKEGKKTRPNSVDNFVFPAIENMLANITSNIPEVTIEGMEENDNEKAKELTYVLRFNDKRNNFRAVWKKMVRQFLSYGPIISAVVWDNDWIGGTGPDRWIGDIRILNINRKEIYFDPAIIDLEERLQECAFIHRRFRKKLSYFIDKYLEKGKFVNEENNDDDMQDEGGDPNQAYLIEAWHKGKPRFVSSEWKKKFEERAMQLEQEGDYYKAQEYKDMALGKLEGVHCAYVANQVFLDYIPYVYEDGKYPFVYKVLYYDENSQFGFGEIRNIKVPQVMHNKADETEIEAMVKEGLGGGYHNKGAISRGQKTEMLRNSGKGGMWFEVDNINGLKEREGVKVPASITNYKEHKQRMIETISQNTPIQQGLAPGANIPYRTIAELGARTDVRSKSKVEILEDFLIELNKLRVSRIVQFYTEDRYYRIKGKSGETISGTFNAKKLYSSWDRDSLDEQGNVIGTKKELFVPDFDIDIKITDERPTDRNYYTSTAADLFKAGAMVIDDLWYTLDEGKFPPKEEILSHLADRDMSMQIAGVLKQVPPEMKEAFMQQQTSLLQQMIAQTQQPQQSNAEAFLMQLPPEVQDMITANPNDGGQVLHQMMQMQPEELQAYIQQIMGGA